jgi:phosphate transport system substrate-binding protein
MCGNLKLQSRNFIPGTLIVICAVMSSCIQPYFKNDYEDNSPTSGKLKVYYDEGLQLHVKNQAYTFEAQYDKAHVETYRSSESEALAAMLKDSCKVIVISRFLNAEEQKVFESNRIFPKYSMVAKSGVALITNKTTPVDILSFPQVKDLLTKPFVCKDSVSNDTKLNVLFDRNNSSVVHYLLDSVVMGEKFSPSCNVLDSTLAAIDYVSNHKNTIAFIDFAWLSDVDDPIYKKYMDRIKFIAVSKNGKAEYPSQSTFKLGTYPFTRTVYVIRKSGEFSLGKGFESFVAGPKGQMTFLKQGLLPTRQQERNVHVNFEPVGTQ